MASKKKLLDQVIEVAARPSNQRFITRYHATGIDYVNDILRKGLSHGRQTTKDGDPIIFTTSVWGKAGIGNSHFNPNNEESNAFIEMKIPKDFYTERVVENPQYGGMTVYKRKENPTAGYIVNQYDRRYYPIEGGGRVDTFKGPIPSKFISRICRDIDDCYSVDDWLKKYGGGSND